MENNFVNSKGNKSLVIIIVILAILLLGCVGYFMYSNGVFGNKANTNDGTNRTTIKTTKANKKNVNNVVEGENYLWAGVYEHKDSEVHSLGKIAFRGKTYEVKYQSKDGINGNFITTVIVNGINYDLDNGFNYIAVMDDSYIVIQGGGLSEYDDLYILDKSFGYQEKELDYNVAYTINKNGELDTKFGKRQFSYIDEKNILVGKCTDDDYQQTYTLNLYTFSDGVYKIKELYKVNNVVCSSQHR